MHCCEEELQKASASQLRRGLIHAVRVCRGRKTRLLHACTLDLTCPWHVRALLR